MASPKVLVIGSGCREHALLGALAMSPQKPQCYCLASALNPACVRVCESSGGGLTVGKITDPAAAVAYAKETGATLCVIGPEAPLEAGVADALLAAGVGCVGPTKDHAQLESSKDFTRQLEEKHKVPGVCRYKAFTKPEGLLEYMRDELEVRRHF